MPPRAFTLPPASTASAKAARSAFFCSLCQKGYSRQNQFEAHESSYDHQHKKRLKEMKEMQRQVKGGVEGRERDREDKGPLVTIKLGVKDGGEDKAGGGKSVGGGGGFKKGGFRNAFAPVGGDGDGDGDVGDGVGGKEVRVEEVKVNMKMNVGDEVSDVTDDEDYYDPRRPTGCMPGCPGHVGG